MAPIIIICIEDSFFFNIFLNTNIIQISKKAIIMYLVIYKSFSFLINPPANIVIPTDIIIPTMQGLIIDNANFTY